MATFPIRDDEYSVEEISYEEMMSVLATQERKVPGTVESISKLHQLAIRETGAKSHHKQDSMSRRIKDNAYRKLPDWLLNH